MIKPSGAFKVISPVYVFLSGVLGGAIPIFMYMGNFPVSRQPYGLQFTHALSFTTWVFLLSILFSGITIILMPSWKVCRDLFSSVIHQSSYKSWRVIGALITSTILYVLVALALILMSERVFTLPQGDFLNELNNRFYVVYFYSALGFLPVIFSIILINYMAGIISADIPVVNSDEKKTVEFIHTYLYYQNILQMCLVAFGIGLSLLPIITAAYMSIWKEIGVLTDETFPVQSIIIYGLIITLMLILIYVPTYFNLTNAGRELRDAKYPYPQQLDDLKGVMEKRKTLDELLQTNIGITENLKNGIFALSPLISGLLAGLLGFK